MARLSARLLGSFVVLVLLVGLGQARTVSWTAAGGTPMWDFANNWDCRCVPGPGDDVIINVPSIVGEVRVGGNPAACNSLVVGGGAFPQQLVVQGQLSVGPGGAKVAANGFLAVQNSPDAPLTCQGTFAVDAAGRFVFSSGALQGQAFRLASANLTGPALKEIRGGVFETTQLIVQSSAEQPAVVSLSKGARLSVSGTATVLGSLQVLADSSSLLDWSGSSRMQGGQVRLQGPVSLGQSAFVDGATLTVVDTLRAKSLTLDQGSHVTFLGQASRQISTVTSRASVLVYGGSLTIDSLDCARLEITGAAVTSTSAMAESVLLVAGSLAGPSTGVAGLGQFTYLELEGGTVGPRFDVLADTLNLTGIVAVDSSNLTATAQGENQLPSQLTLSDSQGRGAFFVLPGNAGFTQHAPLKLVAAGTSQNLGVRLDGAFSCEDDLTLFVPTVGAGVISVGGFGGSVYVIGTSLNVYELFLDPSTNLTVRGGNVTLHTLDGRGDLSIEGQLTVTGSARAQKAVFHSGSSVLWNVDFSVMGLKGGKVGLDWAVVDALYFKAGTLTTTLPGRVSNITVLKMNLVSTEPKTISRMNVTCTGLSLICETDDTCPLMTQRLKLNVRPASEIEEEIREHRQRALLYEKKAR